MKPTPRTDAMEKHLAETDCCFVIEPEFSTIIEFARQLERRIDEPPHIGCLPREPTEEMMNAWLLGEHESEHCGHHRMRIAGGYRAMLDVLKAAGLESWCQCELERIAEALDAAGAERRVPIQGGWRVLSMVERVQSMREKASRDWIACSERLPYEGMRVLATGWLHDFESPNFSNRWYSVAYRTAKGWRSDFWDRTHYDPTHWMPLPSSPSNPSSNEKKDDS